MNEEKTNKSNQNNGNYLINLVAIIILIFLIINVYLNYQSYISKKNTDKSNANNTSNVEVVTTTSLDINSSKVEDLYQLLDVNEPRKNNTETILYYPFYQGKKITASDFTSTEQLLIDTYKLNVTTSNDKPVSDCSLLKDKNTEYYHSCLSMKGLNASGSNAIKYYDNDAIKSNDQLYFANIILPIKYEGLMYAVYYDTLTNKYFKYDIATGFTSGNDVRHQIVSATEYVDRIEITDQFSSCIVEESCFNSSITSPNIQVIGSYSSNSAAIYKHTFKKVVNDKYVWFSSELVNE